MTMRITAIALAATLSAGVFAMTVPATADSETGQRDYGVKATTSPGISNSAGWAFPFRAERTH